MPERALTSSKFQTFTSASENKELPLTSYAFEDSMTVSADFSVFSSSVLMRCLNSVSRSSAATASRVDVSSTLSRCPRNRSHSLRALLCAIFILKRVFVRYIDSPKRHIAKKRPVNVTFFHLCRFYSSFQNCVTLNWTEKFLFVSTYHKIHRDSRFHNHKNNPITKTEMGRWNGINFIIAKSKRNKFNRLIHIAQR